MRYGKRRKRFLPFRHRRESRCKKNGQGCPLCVSERKINRIRKQWCDYPDVAPIMSVAHQFFNFSSNHHLGFYLGGNDEGIW